MTRIFVLALLLIASPVRADDTLFRVSMAVAIVGHGADLAATQHCLGSGRCRELNPWLLRFSEPVPFAVAKMSVASLGIWAASKMPNRRLGAVVNFAVGSGFLWLGVRNSRIGAAR